MIQSLFSQGSTNCSTSAQTLTINTSCSTVNVTNNDNNTATESAANCSGGGSNYADVWYQFTGTGNTINVDLNTNTTGVLAIYSGACPANNSTYQNAFACLQTSSNTTGSLAVTTTTGTSYYVRVQRRSGNSTDNQSGTICAYTPVPAPSNDDPCTAIPITTSTFCNYSTYTNESATSSSGIPAPGCASYSGGDVWFTVTVPASGSLVIDTKEGTMTNSGMAVYSASTCAGPFTLIECDDDDSNNGSMSLLTLTGQTPGATLYLRVWESGNNNNGTFQLCSSEYNSCNGGNPTTNDYCATPATLYYDPTASFSANTAGSFTADMTQFDNSTFCGSIQNNSWYIFTATQSTATFNISSVTGCTRGIQGIVFDMNYNASGCCIASGTSAVSNCYNPGNTTTGTIVASGLTIGNTYILMIDGWAGANCNFTITGWLGYNILPVELTDFSGITLSDHNQLYWETETEHNNDYFEVRRSYDGLNFEKIAKVSGAGNSTEPTYYQFDDYNTRTGNMYYQLVQYDFDGKNEESKILVLNRTADYSGILSVFPNPSNSSVTIELNTDDTDGCKIELIDLNGSTILSKTYTSSGIHLLELSVEELPKGIYLIKYSDNNHVSTTKFTKN